MAVRELKTSPVREKIHDGGMFEQLMNDPGCSCQITPCIECPACSFEIPPKDIYHCPKCGQAIGTITYDGIREFE
jgi:hypothetical protein